MQIQKRKSFSKQTRILIFSRDDSRCRVCGGSSKEVKLVVDHIFPHDKGGTDDFENLASLCEDCNLGKSDLLLRGMLKQKVKNGDLSPIEFPKLFIDFKTVNERGGKEHQYQLRVQVENNTTKSIKFLQLEVILPNVVFKTVSFRGQKTIDGIYAKVFFSKLDIEIIHPHTKPLSIGNIFC